MFVNAENLKIVKNEKSKNLGIFTIEPLLQTFGATIGNALRRVLMTSIRGAAEAKMKISGINYQFTTVAGVKEDVVEISLSVTQLRFKLHGDITQIVILEKKGKGPVTAKDLVLNSDVEIMDKNQPIATISDDKTTLKMEIWVEPGTGYSPMEEREKENAKLGVISLDALYSPIVNATYEVESTRFGERVALDKVILTVETAGSITPEKAVKEAASILKSYYGVIEQGETKVDAIVSEEEKETPIKTHIENIAIEELPLQTRTINALKKHGIETLKELATKSDEELADVKNLGEKSLAEIKELLEKENLK